MGCYAFLTVHKQLEATRRAAEITKNCKAPGTAEQITGNGICHSAFVALAVKLKLELISYQNRDA